MDRNSVFKVPFIEVSGGQKGEIDIKTSSKKYDMVKTKRSLICLKVALLFFQFVMFPTAILCISRENSSIFCLNKNDFT